MGLFANVRERLASFIAPPAPAPIVEAVKAGVPATPERTGYEYGIPRQGINEVYSGLGQATQSDRRSVMAPPPGRAVRVRTSTHQAETRP